MNKSSPCHVMFCYMITGFVIKLWYWCFVSVDTVDSITPDKVRGLRDLLNSSAMDIMYYNSPLYRDEVSVKCCQTPEEFTVTPFLHKTSTLPVSPDYQGPNPGAKQTVHTFLLSEPWVWGEGRQSVHRVPLPWLRHHLWHHDRMGSGALLSAGASRCGGGAGPALDVLWGEARFRAAAGHKDEVELAIIDLQWLLTWRQGLL